MNTLALITKSLQQFGEGPHIVGAKLDLSKPETISGFEFFQKAIEFAYSEGVKAGQSEKEKVTPWYPDDSGKWIEHIPGAPMLVPADTMVEVLTCSERDEKRYCCASDLASYWDWDDIVAYKIVE